MKKNRKAPIPAPYRVRLERAGIVYVIRYFATIAQARRYVASTQKWSEYIRPDWADVFERLETRTLRHGRWLNNWVILESVDWKDGEYQRTHYRAKGTRVT